MAELLHVKGRFPSIEDLTASSKAFQHAPLDRTADSIRLIRILPDLSPDSFIQCTLWHTTTDSAVYTCLSYEWGSDLRQKQIIINDKTFNVARNLFDFFEVARNKNDEPAMWVDAICIDQENKAEKIHQVHLMGKIYSQADEVWSWLGNDTIIARVLNRNRTFTSYIDEGWKDFDKDEKDEMYLTDYSYWKRAWVTQEIMLARKHRILICDDEVDEEAMWTFRELVPLFKNAASLPGQDRERPSLLDLLLKFRNRRCKIKRDTIYSLLALCREGPQIRVDYTISDRELLRTLIESCRKTLCLCAPTLLAQPLDMPQGLSGYAVIRNIMPSRFKLGQKIYCYTCTEFLWTHVASKLDTLVCFNNHGCGANAIHFLWKKPAYDSQTSEFRILVYPFWREVRTFMCRVSGFAQRSQVQRGLDIVLPLKALYNVGTGLWDRPEFLRDAEHLNREKDWMELFDPSRDSLSNPYIWVGDSLEDLDLAHTSY